MANNKKKRKIPKPQSPQDVIPKQQPLKSDNGFSFSTVYSNWIKGTHSFYKSTKFTNMLKNTEEFSRNITEITIEIIPKLYNEHKQLFHYNNGYNPHCHIVAKDKKELVKKIAEEIHQTEFDETQLNEARIQWWYLGFKGSLRLLGLYDLNKEIFYPLFIDHHHLIHESETYNQPDYEKYDYCPVQVYNNPEN